LTDQKSDAFFNPQKYNYLVEKVHSFWNNWANCITSIAENILSHEQPIPDQLRKVLREDMDLIQAQRPDFIGFSILVEQQMAYALLLAKLLRRQIKVPILFGGAFMSYVDVTAFLQLFDFVDFAIDKEGERGLEAFIRHFRRQEMDKVPGVYFRDGQEVRRTHEKYVDKLGSLPPPDFSEFDLGRYLAPAPVLPVKTSRGCYWKKCTFCNYHRAYPQPFKSKSLKKVVEEFKHYSTQGIRHFFIVDDAISAERLQKMSREIQDRGLKIVFGAIVRPESNFTLEALETIYKGGGRVLVWGVESSSQRILDLMRKGTRVEDIQRILRDAHRLGFLNLVFMIRGFPTQTEEEIYGDTRFLLDHWEFIDNFAYHDFGVARDSYIFHHPERFKVKNIKDLILFKCKEKKPVLYGDFVSFSLDRNLNWKEIHPQQLKMIQPFWKNTHEGVKIRSYEHSHLLLHASYGRSERNETPHRFLGQKNRGNLKSPEA